MPSDAATETDEPLFSEADERQLCLTCLEPNDLSAHFCAKCGGPMTSYAATGPIERILAEGYAYRRAVERPRRPMVVLGIWLLFGLNVPFALFGIAKAWKEGTEGLPMAVLCLFIFATSLVILWRTTRNYLIGKRSASALAGRVE